MYTKMLICNEFDPFLNYLPLLNSLEKYFISSEIKQTVQKCIIKISPGIDLIMLKWSDASQKKKKSHNIDK